MTTAIDADDGSLRFLVAQSTAEVLFEIEGGSKKKEGCSRAEGGVWRKVQADRWGDPCCHVYGASLDKRLQRPPCRGSCLDYCYSGVFCCCCGPFAKYSIASIPRTHVNKKKHRNLEIILNIVS